MVAPAQAPARRTLTSLTWESSAVAAGALAVIVAWALHGANETTLATSVLAVGHLALGVMVFLRHGGWRITATGIYFFATGLLSGGAALVVVHRTSFPDQLWSVMVFSFLAHLGLLWLRMRGEQPAAPERDLVAGGPIRWLLPVGVAYLVAGVLLKPFTASALFKAFGFVGVLLLGTALVYALRQPQRSRAMPEAVLFAFGGLIFVDAFFTGEGRLNLLNLLLCVALLSNRPWPAAWHKRVAVAAVIPLVLLAGLHRLNAFANQFGTATGIDLVIQSGEGLGSLLNPIDLFAEIVAVDEADVDSSLGRQLGRSYIVTALAFVPRGLWPDKPISFGAELSEALRPLAPEGHSLAALIGAEFYVNFWWFGLALLAVVMAWVLRRLDGLLVRWVDRPATAADLVFGVMVVALSVGMMDLVWGGTFTFISRAPIRAILLLPLLFLAEYVGGRSRPAQPIPRTAEAARARMEGAAAP